MYNNLAFIILAGFAVVVTAAAGRRIDWIPRRLLMAGVFLRIFGATVRYEVLERFYGGVGDATGYYGKGLRFAERVWSFDFTVLSADQWFSDRWWGTPFVQNLSGLAVSVSGPSMRAEFLLFSLAAFAGLCAVVTAFARYHPGPVAGRFAAFVFLWPSLWFWPSSVGKEAIIFLGLGLTVLGYAGRRGRPTWWLLGAGLLLVFCIRPHFAMVLAFSMAAAGWFARWKRFTLRRVVEVVVAAAVAILAFQGMTAQFGLGEADLEGIREFAEERSQQSIQGGSSMGETAMAGAALPLAVVNVWFRPFLWEAHNPMAAVASLEMILFWFLVLRNRRQVLSALKRWRQSRLLAFAIPFIVAFTLMVGMVMGNLGLLARQRTPLFPFAFMVVAAGWVLVPAHRRAHRAWAVRAGPAVRRLEVRE